MPEPQQTLILELRPEPDPLTRHGYPPRAVMYRLKRVIKRALRAEGFRCVRILDSASLRGPPCPKCQSPLDDLSRCWKCVDWVCVCGRMTGSTRVYPCLTCRLEEQRKVP